MADNGYILKISLVVRDMSVCPALKITPTGVGGDFSQTAKCDLQMTCMKSGGQYTYTNIPRRRP